MKTFKLIDWLLRHESEVGPSGRHRLKLAPSAIVGFLLEEEPAAESPLLEATVHRSKRSSVYVATFTGPDGGQVWKTTGLTDYDQALLLARHWEVQARVQRTKLGRTPSKLGIRVHRPQTGTRIGFSQKEVAQMLNLSERGVRAIERRALRKLFNHPRLKEIWSQYLSGELDEDSWALEPAEIAALFDLARTPDEFRLIEKILLIVQPEPRNGV
jgi:hypothetical protein